MPFKAIERCTLERATLIQLHAAIKRLEDQGWKRSAERPLLRLDRSEPCWGIAMQRLAPRPALAEPAISPEKTRAELEAPFEVFYTPAAGLL